MARGIPAPPTPEVLTPSIENPASRNQFEITVKIGDNICEDNLGFKS